MTTYTSFNAAGEPIQMTVPADDQAADAMWLYRRYLAALREFMFLRAKAGERPSQTLGASNGAWAHRLLDRLIEVADDPDYCEREARRLEAAIADMKKGAA